MTLFLCTLVQSPETSGGVLQKAIVNYGQKRANNPENYVINLVLEKKGTFQRQDIN